MSLRLRTERLDLRSVTLEEARALLAGDATAGGELSPARGWPHADTLDGMRAYAEHGTADHEGPWLVVLRETGEVIGDAGWFGGPDPDGDAEIGYGLSSSFHRAGYGTEAVRALCAWVKEQPGVRRVVATVHVDNAPSRRLLEGLGFGVDREVETDEGPHVRYAAPAPV